MNSFIPFVAPSTGPRVDFSAPYDTASLKGRSALVTGGSFGIGRGLTEGLAEAGVYVTFCDIKDDEGKELEKELRDKGLNAQFVKTDVTSWTELIAAFKAAVAFSPQRTVDIVIPNAGVAGPSLAHWLMDPAKDAATGDPLAPPSRVVDVNYMAVFNTVHAAMYFFKAFPGDDHFPATAAAPSEGATAAAAAAPAVENPAAPTKLVILVSSMGGYNPMPSVLNYNSAKWGVRGLFWSLRNIERILGPNKPGFRINLIAPTWVRTNMTKGFVARAGEADESPFKIAEVSDCVHVVMRMAADESIKGRAAAIAANKQSFDLCDESEGVGVGQVISDPEYIKRHYEVKAPAPAPAIEEPQVWNPAAIPTQMNGNGTSSAVPKQNGAAAEKENGVAETEIGGAVQAIKEAASAVKEVAAPVSEKMAAATMVETVAAPVANAA